MMFSVLEKIMLASSVLGKCRVWPPLCDPIRFNFKRRKLLALLSTSVKSLLLGLLISLCFNLCNCDEPFYTDQFVLQINGPPSVAQQLAEKHGFIYLDQIFDNHYHVKHKRIVKRSILPHNLSDSDIFSEPLVNSLTQLKLKRRSKRDLLRLHSFERTNRGRGRFDDPKWTQMWYLNRGQGLDMNVQKVWEMNITGRGVVVTILDDGLENDHPDLIDNYDPKASYDVNNSDEDPTPRYDLIDSNRHGTRCAGEVAAMANNSNCAVGVAFHAKVGGVRMLDGDVTDAVEARSLSFNRDHIHIYSASWGPDDDGKTVDGPGELATKAFLDGVRNGRGGLGSIFIWASGNGGREHDNCNCDGYTNSIWTLSISSVTENGLVPWYSEACSSTLATTYSSGSYGERQIVTTDLHHSCTTTHTGTSASAPLAAGISALVLEANPKLTWRDMQHIVVLTSRPANLHAKDWKTNGVGRNVSHSFGYGLMDAEAMVKTAKDWVTVPDQKICSVRSPPVDKLIPAKSHIELYLDVSCSQVNYLEHVQTKVTLTATRRGDIHIYLTSPSGTKATLLAQRPMDNSRSGFQNWPFMSVHTWGENPNGLWKLEVHNEGRYIYNTGNYPSLLGRAYLKEWTLFMYGTTEQPDRRTVKPSKPDVHTTNTKPYFNDKLGNDLDKSFDDNSAANPGNSKISNSFTRKPYPIPGWSPRYQQKPLPSSLDKALKKPIGPSLDNNDISLLSSANQNTQHNSVLGAIHGTREDKSQESASGTNYKLGKSYNRGCVLKDLTSHCLECSHDMVLINGVCLESCPEGYFRSKISLKLGSESSICSRCHYSCKSCHGPADNNCSQCFPDAQLNQHGYCHARSLIQEILALERWYTTVTVVFFVLCFVILILVVYIVTGRNHDLICCIVESNRSEPFTYVDVPLKSDQNRRRSSSRKISAHDAREIIQLSKKILREETSEDDL